MSSIPRTTIAVLMLSTGLVMADWKLNGRVVPDTPWARSAGDFGVQLVLTDKPDELFAAWEKPGPIIFYSETTTARRGIPIMAVVFFAGCLPDAKGECDATVRYQAYTPDGKPWGDPVDAELWTGKKAPDKEQMQLSVGNMGIVIDPDDPLGVYKVKATVVDKHAKKTVVVERTFTAVEVESKPTSARAAAGPGADAAAHHVRFAHTLAASRLRLSGDLDRVTSEIENRDCKVTAAATGLLAADQKDIAKAIASDYCRPWEKFWDRLSRSCDAEKPPQWCDDEAAVLEHLDLDGYFSGLTAALRTSDAELVRENLMDVVLAAFSAHVIGDFGNEPPNRWATETVDAYVTTASFDQVVALARRLKETWVGLTPGVVGRLREYSQHHEGLTAEQQNQIESLLAERSSKEHGTEGHPSP